MYYYTSAHGAAPERASLPGPMHRRHFATPRASRAVRYLVRALAPTGQGAAVPSILPFFAGLRVR